MVVGRFQARPLDSLYFQFWPWPEGKLGFVDRLSATSRLRMPKHSNRLHIRGGEHVQVLLLM